MNKTTYKLSLNSKNLSEEIKKSLKFNGIAIVENFLNSSKVDELNDTLKLLFENKDTYIDRGQSVFVNLTRKKIDQDKYLSKIVKESTILDTARWFYSERSLNYDAYAHIDSKGSEVNTSFHQDPTVCIKFYFHLSDVTRDIGAMRYCLGSHLEGFLRLKYEISGGSLADTFGYSGEAKEITGNRNVIDVSSPSGSLIIFNTAGLHAAGVNRTDAPRKILRFQLAPQIGLKTKVVRKLRNSKALPYSVRRVFARMDYYRAYCSSEALPLHQALDNPH